MAQAQRKLFPVKVRGGNRESRIAVAVGVQVAQAVEAALGSVADDAYNAAVLNNPLAFALTQPKDASVSVSSENAVRAYRNLLSVPVAIVIRADGPDVSEVLASSAAFSGTEAQIRGQNQIVGVLLPNQEVWVSVRALNYPNRLATTAIPLRGKATVFGG